MKLVVVIFYRQTKEAVIPIIARSRKFLQKELQNIIEKRGILEVGRRRIDARDVNTINVYTLKEWFDYISKPYPT